MSPEEKRVSIILGHFILLLCPAIFLNLYGSHFFSTHIMYAFNACIGQGSKLSHHNFILSIQEQVYLQQMKNTMGKDAYHPLVAYPYPTSNAHFEPVVQPGTK